jgi:antitoxin (DNA-binding transcriptional repressor) of toxin-antitoxin stability system
MNKIIPITDLRRRFGEITEDILNVESYVLTKGGRPFAILKAAPELKKARMKKAAGGWAGTDLADDDLWAKVFQRKSRKQRVEF